METKNVLDQALFWEVKSPFKSGAFGFSETDSWLAELREMRGRVLYENGLRPYFRKNGYYLDADCFDLNSYHILVKVNNKIVGCVRLLPLEQNIDCVTSEIVEKSIFSSVLFSVFDNITKLSEASRWIVEPSYQPIMVGCYLGYALWALANHLGYRFVANAGHKREKLLSHYGGVYFPEGAGPYHSQKYNDDVHLLYFDKRKLSETALKHIDRMSNILNLSEV